MSDPLSTPPPSEVPAPHVRPFEDLSPSGLLWLINRTVFHPRGFALGLAKDENGNIIGWALQGDGAEPWWFNAGSESDLFNAAKATLAEAAEASK